VTDTEKGKKEDKGCLTSLNFIRSYSARGAFACDRHTLASMSSSRETISSIFDELDLIAAGADAGDAEAEESSFLAFGGGGGSQSASSILLAERKLAKQKADMTSMFAAVAAPVKSTHKSSSSYAYDQIAASTVEAPTYWKGVNIASVSSSSGGKGKKGGKGGGAVKGSVRVLSKATKAKHQKGQEYKDRSIAKLASKDGKKLRKQLLKKAR